MSGQEFDVPAEPDTVPIPPPPQEKRLGYLLLAFLFGALVPTIICFVLPAKARMEVQAEAVKAGHAVYRVVDEYGATRFEWLPPHEGSQSAPEKK